jgi:hypothetical protein
MFTRLAQRKRPRAHALLGIGGAFAAATLLAVSAVLALVSDTGDYSVVVADKFGFEDADIGNATVEYIGDSNTTFGSSGTGTFNPFVRLQGSPTEKGYNTNGTTEFQTKVGNWTHAILVSDIPIVDCDGTGPGTTQCWELWVDINEGNKTPRVSLDAVEIYFTSNANLTGYSFGANATKVYEFHGSILINDVNQGSGRGDLRYLVELTNITLPAPGTWFVLYSEWGAVGNFENFNYNSDGGFEEWKVKVYPTTSTATQVKKSVDSSNIADGESVPIGTNVFDTATLSGQGIGSAGGTVSYYYQKQTNATPTCTPGTLIGSAVNVTNGVVPPSASVLLSSAGTYEFWAVYSGDVNNTGSTSTCGSETVVVGRNNPTAATTQSLIPNDTFTLSGATSDAGGTVDFYLFAPGVTCSEANIANAAFSQLDVALVGNTTASTSNTGSGAGSYVATIEGASYRWLVIYEGDANNEPETSNCVESFTIDN